MKSDKNGCSVCKEGKESYEMFYSSFIKKEMCQYDFRHKVHGLFSCVRSTLEACREHRDRWIYRKEITENQRAKVLELD